MKTQDLSHSTAAATGSGYIEEMARDLGNANLEIPGFPDVAIRLNKALQDEDASVKDIVALIKSEPGLVSRLLQMANSVAFNPSGTSIADLRTAINRLGFKTLFSVSSSYAMRQIQQQESLKPLRPWLAEIWMSSNSVAAMTFVVAKRAMPQLANEAMVAGLLHRVGDLYLLIRAQQRNVDLQNDKEWEQAAAKWHATIASEMMRQWELPAHVADAVSQQDALANGDTEGVIPFAMLLSAGKLYNQVSNQRDDDMDAFSDRLESVELWGQRFLDVVAESHEEIENIRAAIL